MKLTYLSDHPVPNAADQLAVLAVGDQVEVVGKLYGAGQLLQDVYAEAFTAQFSVRLSVTHNTKRQRERERETVNVMALVITKNNKHFGGSSLFKVSCGGQCPSCSDSVASLHYRFLLI